jgi:glycosyltransferase involved in cell wall biosynthesis
MRVLVWQWGRYGSGPRYALELSDALQAHCKVKTLLSMAKGSEMLAHPDQRAKVDLPIETYRGKLDFIAKTLQIGRQLDAIDVELRRTKPDIAINAMLSYWDVFFVRRLQQLGIPVVTIIHDATTHPGDNFPLVQSAQRRIVDASDAVITLTDYVAGRLRAQPRWHATPLSIIPHPCFEYGELQLVPPSPPAPAAKRPLRLLLAGRIKAYKGLEVLSDALDHLPPGKVSVRIAGPSDNGAGMKAMTQKHDVDLQLGWCTDAQFFANVDWADVLVLPYIEASQSGVIPLAYSRARPVIVTPVGGLPEQVAHQESGLIADNTSGRAVAAAIMRMIEQPALLQTCSQGALRLAQQSLSWHQIAPRFAEALRGIVETRTSARAPMAS